MTTQHTPTPWSLGFKDSQNIYSDNKQIACVYCSNKDWSNNAEFIVRACNAHDGLISLLNKVALTLKPLSEGKRDGATFGALSLLADEVNNFLSETKGEI